MIASQCKADGGSVVGPGSTPIQLTTVDDSGDPIPGVAVYVSTDSAGANVVAGTLYSSDFGTVIFMLEAGSTYYVWQDSSEFNFTNPTEITT